MPFSPGGSGLFLVSLTAVVEEVGVPWFEELGECVFATRVEPVLGDGEAVPEVLSFLFFDLLLDSLALESCSCYVSQRFRRQKGQQQRLDRWSGWASYERLTTRCLKPFIVMCFGSR